MNYSHVLRIRSFRDLWLGQAISQLGDAFYYIVFMFMAKKLTGSDGVVATVGVLETLPYLLFSAYAGVAADRFDRRKVMLWSDIASGAALFGFAAFLVFNPKPPLFMLLVMPFLLSTMRCFFMPAKSAAIPAVVPKNLLQLANSLSSTTQNIVPLVGLALTGGVLTLLWVNSPEYFFLICVALNTVSFLLSAWFIARLPVLKAEQKAQESHALTDFVEGVRYIRRRPDLITFIAMTTGFRLGVAPFFVAYLAANDAWFGGGPSTLTWMEFSFFVGMVAAAPLMGKVKVEHPGRWFATGLFVVGLMVGLMAFSRTFALFVILNIVCGLAVPPADIPVNTWLQKSVPDAFLGRVNSVLNMVATGAMPMGLALGGVLIRQIGTSGLFMAMGGVMMVACAAGFLTPAFRNARMDPDVPTDDPTPLNVQADEEVESTAHFLR
ncbi:MFS transporter [bacterium]|nr:MAG: MFS transporter [bacterium]